MDWLLEHSGDDECDAPDCKAESASTGALCLPHLFYIYSYKHESYISCFCTGGVRISCGERER